MMLWLVKTSFTVKIGQCHRAWGENTMRVARFALPSLIAAMISVPAMAQSTAGVDTAIDRADAAASRAEGTGGAEAMYFALDGGKAAKNWSLTLSAPFTFNNNVALANTGKKSAMHSAPSVELKGNWAIATDVNFSLAAKADIDAYTAHSENDQSGLTGTAELSIGDQTKRLAPYLRYTGNALYSDQWGAHKVTTHVFAIGLRRKWTLDDGQAVSIDTGYARREATIITAEQHRYIASLRYDGKIDGKTSWSLAARVQRADYTGGSAAARNDTQMRLGVGVSRVLTPSLTLSADMVFLRNWSNVTGKGYSDIDVGPGIKLTGRF